MLNDLTHDLRAMRLLGMAVALQRWVEDPTNAERSALDCVHHLVSTQREMSQHRRTEGFHVRFRVPPQMTLAAFEPSNGRGISPQRFRHLEGLAWLDAGQNVVVTGPSQTGKTHLAVGLALQAYAAGHTVHIQRVPELLAQLAASPDAKASAALVERLSRPVVLVLDDLATDVATADQTSWLRRLLERRAARKGAVIVTSIADPDEWSQFFDNPAAADGIHGRLTHNAHEVSLKRRGAAKMIKEVTEDGG
jgi:DNA replication protein DnaC